MTTKVAYLLLFLMGISQGFFFIPYKIGLELISTEAFVLGMYAFGTLSALPVILKKNENEKGWNKETFIIGISFAIFSILGNYFNGLGLKSTTPAIIAVVSLTQTLWVFAGASLLFKENITKAMLAGSLTAIIGVAIMGDVFTGRVEGVIEGITWSTLGVIGFAVGTLVMKAFSKGFYPNKSNFLRFAIGLLLLMTNTTAVKELWNASLYVWFLIALTAAFGPIICRLIIMHTVKVVPVSHVSLFNLMTPVTTVIAAVLILQEMPTTSELIGGAIVTLGAMLPTFEGISKARQIKKNNQQKCA